MRLLNTFIFILLFASVQSQQTLNIYFDFDKHHLTPAAITELDDFINKEKNNFGTNQLELHGHCDFKGEDDYNFLLSEKRVASVKDYLISRGVSPESFSTLKGHGEKLPVNDNLTAEDRQLNRRVEVRILKSDTAKSLTERLKDPRTVAGTKIVLKNINFVGSRTIFLEESFPALDELLIAMNTYPGLVIRVEGHICCQPGADDGVDLATGFANLSEARARAVRDWLINNGISGTRIGYQGYGHSAPLYPYPEKSEFEMIANRRVEIRIIRK